MKRTRLIIVVVLAAWGQSLPALPPTAIIGADFEQLWVATSESRTSRQRIDADGSFSWRTALPALSGFAAIRGRAELAYIPANETLFDTETLSTELGFGLGPGLGRTELTISSSIAETSRFVDGSVRLAYDLDQLSGDLVPIAAVGGGTRWSPVQDSDRYTARGELGLRYEPGIETRLSSTIDAAWHRYREQVLATEDGDASNTPREDLTSELSLSWEQLLGYYTELVISVAPGYRFSNNNRYLESVPTLERNSDSRATGRAGVALSWSPIRQLSVRTNGRLLTELYTDRAPLDSSGEPASGNLHTTEATVGISSDVTFDDHLFFSLDLSLSRSFSKQTSLERTTTTISGGVEYSF